MSKQKKRVSLAEQPVDTPEAQPADVAASSAPQPQDVPLADAPAVQLEEPSPPDAAPLPSVDVTAEAVSTAKLAPSVAGAVEKPGIEVQPLFWFVMGSLTVGIMVLAGLLMMNPKSAAANPKASAPTAVVARPSTSTPVAQATRPAQASQPDAGATITAAVVANESVPRVSLPDTKQKLDAGQILFVDVRAKESYDQQHAKGAINIPQGDTVARLSELPKDKDIVLYCA
jgi:hypothetical protein